MSAVRPLDIGGDTLDTSNVDVSQPTIDLRNDEASLYLEPSSEVAPSKEIVLVEPVVEDVAPFEQMHDPAMRFVYVGAVMFIAITVLATLLALS